MIVEGKGPVAPKPITISLMSHIEVRSVRSFVRTLVEQKGFAERNCLIGWFGESATSKFILDKTGIKHLCNLNYLPEGDGRIDFEIYGMTGQVKTRHRNKTCRILRIRDQKIIPLYCDIFVFCNVLTPLNEPDQKVELLGWITKENLERYGERKNEFLYIDRKYLFPMSRLIKEIEAEKLLQWH